MRTKCTPERGQAQLADYTVQPYLLRCAVFLVFLESTVYVNDRGWILENTLTLTVVHETDHDVKMRTLLTQRHKDQASFGHRPL
jgi:hypothetical protein